MDIVDIAALYVNASKEIRNQIEKVLQDSQQAPVSPVEGLKTAQGIDKHPASDQV